MLTETKPNIALVHKIFADSSNHTLPWLPCHLSLILVMPTCNQETVEIRREKKLTQSSKILYILWIAGPWALHLAIKFLIFYIYEKCEFLGSLGLYFM